MWQWPRYVAYWSKSDQRVNLDEVRYARKNGPVGDIRHTAAFDHEPPNSAFAFRTFDLTLVLGLAMIRAIRFIGERRLVCQQPFGFA